MYKCGLVPHYLLFGRAANVLQISGKQTYSKGIETMNPINAKCVQLIELHAFAYCLLCICSVALFHLLEIGVLDVVILFCAAIVGLL